MSNVSECANKQVLLVEGLTKHYGNLLAVEGISFSVNRGEVYVLLGPNGAGKSTTIKMITGSLVPNAGKVNILGLNIWEPDSVLHVKRQISVVPEELIVYGNLTAREFLTFVGRMYLMSPDRIRNRIAEVSEVLAIENVLDKFANEYSRGMKKRVLIAGALITNPKIIFMDEPFDSMDPIVARSLHKHLIDFAGLGGTIVYTSHVLELVERFCSRFAIMYAGRLLEESRIESVLEKSSLSDYFHGVIEKASKMHETRSVSR